jgi:hypothetical protein
MKKLNILTDKTIKANKPKDKKYYLNDGDGLYLLITPNNYKIWVFRFMINNKRYETTFKSYPSVSLSEARKKRDDYRKLINDKINPIHHFRELNKKQIIEDKSNLQNIFNEWLENQKTNSGLNQWDWKKQRIYKDVILPLGIDTNVNDVTIDDIKKVQQFILEIRGLNLKILFVFKFIKSKQNILQCNGTKKFFTLWEFTIPKILLIHL